MVLNLYIIPIQENFIFFDRNYIKRAAIDTIFWPTSEGMRLLKSKLYYPLSTDVFNYKWLFQTHRLLIPGTDRSHAQVK